jgi:hypothetical protein
MNQDVLGVLSKYINPRILIALNMQFYKLMRENKDPQNAELHYSATNILHSVMNPFMKSCMEAFWQNQFNNGILLYTTKRQAYMDGKWHTVNGEVISLRFSDYQDGRVDLSQCNDAASYQIITTSVDDFFKAGEESLVVGSVTSIVPRYVVEQKCQSKKHPFASILAAWDGDKFPIGIFRQGGNKYYGTGFYYQTSASISKISSMNLFDVIRDAYWYHDLNMGPSQDITIPPSRYKQIHLRF